METKQTRLQKILDREINIYQIGIIEYNFFNGTSLNAKGRFYTKILLVLLSFLYFAAGGDAIISACLISVLSFMIPPLVDIAGKVVIEKMGLRDNNIYDITAAVGGYALVLAPPIIAAVFIADKLPNLFPDIFLSINVFTGTIICAGLVGVLSDGLLMLLESEAPDKNSVHNCTLNKNKVDNNPML